MTSKKLTKTKLHVSTQQYLDIAEIKDNTVVLKDGTLRGILLVSSINFSLKSDEEQDAIINAYISFLNSLNHPLEIIIQSRKLNIDGYIDGLEEVSKNQTNELLKAQTEEYRNYIKELISLGDIMTKRFYVAVPYSPFSDKPKGFFARLFEVFSPTKFITLREAKFQEYHMELEKRMGYITSGLESMGLAAITLDTQSLIELFYNTYNPETSKSEKLVEVGQLQTE
jgi:type IV secretory pathway VirB4 component